MQSSETIPEWKRVLLEKQKQAGLNATEASGTNVKVDLPQWAQKETPVTPPTWQPQKVVVPASTSASAESARQKYEARKVLGVSGGGLTSPRPSSNLPSPRPSNSQGLTSPRLRQSLPQPGEIEEPAETPAQILERVSRASTAELPAWKKNLIELRKSNEQQSTSPSFTPLRTSIETPSWKKDETTRDSGIDWNTSLVKPQAITTVTPPQDEISQLPLWQQRLLQTKQEKPANTHTNARQAYQERSAQKAGVPLEPIQPGLPAWKQRVLQSKSRVEAHVGAHHEKNAAAEAAEWQKRLLGSRKERQDFAKAHSHIIEEVLPETTLTFTRPIRKSTEPATVEVPKPEPVKDVEKKDKANSWSNKLSEAKSQRARARGQSVSRRKQLIEEVDEPVELKLEARLPVVSEEVPEIVSPRVTHEVVNLALPILSLSIEENVEVILPEIKLAQEEVLSGDLQLTDLGEFLLPKIVIPKFVIPKPEPVQAPVATPTPVAPIPQPEPEKPKTESEWKKLIEAEEKMVKDQPNKASFKKTAWHEQYKALGVINQILATPNFTLDDLLVEAESVVLVAGSPKDNKKLVSILSAPDNLIKLLRYAIEEPVLASTVAPDQIPVLQKRLKVTESCLQLILQTSIVLNKISKSPECLTELFSRLKLTKAYVVFARIIQILMLLFMLDPRTTATYLIQQEGFMEEVIRKVGSSALSEDILMLIRLIVKASKKAPELTEWFLKSNSPQLLTERLAPHHPAVIHEEAAHILGEILAELKMNSQEDAEEQEKPEMSPIGAGIIAQFKDEQNIDTLFAHLKNSSSSLIQILSLFETVLEADIEGEDSILLLKFIDNLGIFLDLLVPVENNPKLVKTSTGVVPSFGPVRLAVLKFILVLVSEEPDVGCILVENGFYSLALEMFFDYPTNSVVHDIVLQCFLLLSARDEDEVMEVFVSTNLLDRIGSVWEEFLISHEHLKTSKKTSESNKVPLSIAYGQTIEKRDGQILERYPAYFGHLAILANMIADMTDEKPALHELIDMSDRWKSHFQTNIDDYNMSMINMTSAS